MVGEFDRRRKPERDYTFPVRSDDSNLFSVNTRPDIEFVYTVEIKGMRDTSARINTRLLAPALKLLGRIGGDTNFDSSILKKGKESTGLGTAIVYFAALFTYLFDDPYLFRSGQLHDLGERLANSLGLSPIAQATRAFGVSADRNISIRVSEINEGSLIFRVAVIAVKTVSIGAATVASVISIAAEAPEAYENYLNHYEPAIEETWDATTDNIKLTAQGVGSFMSIFFERVQDLIEVTTIPTPPTPSQNQLRQVYYPGHKTKKRSQQVIQRL